MKRRKLRKPVLYILIGTIIISIIISLIVLDNMVVNNAIEKCTNAGHSIAYCKSGL